MKKVIGIVFLAVFLLSFYGTQAQELKDKVGVSEHLGDKLPLDAKFLDSEGNQVSLKNLINKPTVIDFAYYKCTGICTPLMTEIADVMNKVDLRPGKDYNVLTISFNDEEMPKDAARKKSEMINLLDTRIPADGWRFLTGDSADIYKVAKAAGFNFEREGATFLHTGVLIFVSSDGKICRYLRPGYTERGDFRILPFDFKMAIVEASKGEAIPVIDKALKYCFSYQPKHETYVLDIFKVSGAGILLLVAVFFVFVVVRPKKNVKKAS